jgi:hypothetical protein
LPRVASMLAVMVMLPPIQANAKVHRHSGARAKRASPESITTIVNMDSGPAPKGASRNDGGE